MGKIAFGVDLGWVSQLESRGFHWVDEEGKNVDPIQAAKDMGADSVRLRVFVNPPKEAYWQKYEDVLCMLGFCDAQSVLEVSKRVKENGMRLMIDFHYSDHFADPLFQDIPDAWKQDDSKMLTERVYQHTKDVMMLLKENDIFPEWVQVGNEINPGILLPKGSLDEAPEQLVTYLNAGYSAVKECSPDTKVITHITFIHDKEMIFHFFDTFFEKGGKTDILGFSHYPYWFHTGSDIDSILPLIQEYQKKYQKPVMICEVGGPETDEEGTYQLLVNTIESVYALPEDQGLGVFYWEPAAAAATVPDGYPLGAARMLDELTLQYTKALTAFKKYNK